MSRRRALLLIPAAAVVFALGWGGADLLIGDGGAPGPGGRKRPWATPLERPGLRNFFRVSPELYRGAQPEAAGIRELEKLGVKTIVNLRLVHSDRDEIAESGVTGLNYEHITMSAWHAEDKEIVRFLRIVNDPEKTPVFVHCKHGSDRTGTMCAMYRIFIEGWSREEALEEMTKGPFGFHRAWRNLPRYIRDLDVEEIRRRAGLGAAPAGSR